MGFLQKQILAILVVGFVFGICLGHGGHYQSPVHHQCGHDHGFPEDGYHDHHQHEEGLDGWKLPEELAEEEDLKLYGFGIRHHRHHDDDDRKLEYEGELHGVGLWVQAMGCSLLVSLASLICLIILPLIFTQGKPSRAVVDSLAVFGAGAMLGDAFLHQLPHAFGHEQSHTHAHEEQHVHDHVHLEPPHSHLHSLKDLSVGLSVLAGIVLFLLVEKIVRYVEDASGGATSWGHSHHHHHKKDEKLKDDHGNLQPESVGSENESASTRKKTDELSDESLNGKKQIADEPLLRRRNVNTGHNDKPGQDATNGSPDLSKSLGEKGPARSSSNLVFGYLNLFSDGVHNFTDGMALGSAFLLHGSVGGWSRTLFLLAHELPQEVGDFGILVRSGFSVSRALFFNFLSALVALAGTALALLVGQNPGQSSLIEGFTAGGFIYIAVAGVLAEMNNSNSTVKSTVMQLTFLILGMMVALCISLVE